MNLSKLTYISELYDLEKIWETRLKKLYDVWHPKKQGHEKALTLYNLMIRRLSILREINRKIDLKEIFY